MIKRKTEFVNQVFRLFISFINIAPLLSSMVYDPNFLKEAEL